jgi:hypothetical protein
VRLGDMPRWRDDLTTGAALGGVVGGVDNRGV